MFLLRIEEIKFKNNIYKILKSFCGKKYAFDCAGIRAQVFHVGSDKNFKLKKLIKEQFFKFEFNFFLGVRIQKKRFDSIQENYLFERLSLIQIKFVSFKQSIFEQNKYFFKSNKFRP